jgi:signal transduction histidine kinase
MPSGDHCTVDQLAKFFAGCQEEVISEWRVQAGELLSELNLDKPTITDHLPDVIGEITRDLALGRYGTLSEEHTRGSPPVHGGQAVRLAVMAFAAQQALIRKEQEDEHLAFVAHDLRTPLNAVSLLVDHLRLGLDEKATAEAGDLFEIIRRNLQRVEDLIKKCWIPRCSRLRWEALFAPSTGRLSSGLWFNGSSSTWNRSRRNTTLRS